MRRLEEECEDLKRKNWMLIKRINELEEDVRVYETIQNWAEDDHVEN